MSKMRIFISHTHTDTDFAKRLMEGLDKAGADVWLDDANLSTSQSLDSSIKQEIRERPVFVFVVSNEANTSPAVQKEIDLAQSCHHLQKHRIVLPVLAHDTDRSTVDPWIGGFWRVEGSSWKALPPEEAVQKTIAALQREVLLYYPKQPVDIGQSLFKRYEELGGESESSLGFRLLVDRDAAKPDTSPQGTVGYRLRCSAGGGSAAIYWSERGGAQPVWGAIRQVYTGRGSRHGFPLTREIEAGTSPQGTTGVYQRFEGSWNYPEEVTGPMRYGATVYWSPNYGAKTTWGGIGEYYERLGGTNSRLGFPRHSEHVAVKSHRGTEGWYQVFEGGTVHWSKPAGARTVSGPIRDYSNSLAGSGSWLGFPMSEEAPAAPSPFGTTGTFQRFEGEWDYPDDVIALLADVRCGATVYFSDTYGAQPTGWGIGFVYERMHGTAGVLGFPASPELRIPGAPSESADRMQRFEGGTIYCRAQDWLIVPVLNAVHTIYEKLGGVTGEMGFPLAPAEPVSNGEQGQCMQRFEGGIIAVEGTQDHAW